ncbi:signal transduction histidine kinase [Clostridium punense]|uniref:histidine kinase n=1 Tax=Clostridium punense TaxID=1054297 RepID=A0ABS4K3I2_9CLOT|nr:MULTISPECIES: HAMP domain-containing sensor histidine kinase [Clostridium]EQB87252.1 hypothetical protein M918_10105 [Clostridium sp. BL8]MBP2022347.1 signal transduction histidine kinase [Clostridium punense]
MRYRSKVLIFLLVVILSVISNITVYGQPMKKEKLHEILIINSYDREQLWEKNIISGLQKNLNGKFNARYTIEYLDIKNNNSKEYLKELSDILKIKYEGKKFDLVVALNDEALNFTREYHNTVFNEAPVIFIGINEEVKLTAEEAGYFTGLSDNADERLNIDLIKKLYPEIKIINFILDDTVYSKNTKKRLEKLQPYYYDVQFNYIEGTRIEDIVEKVSNTPRPFANLIIGVFSDGAEKESLPREAVEKLKGISPYPLFSKSQNYLSQGVLGGKMDLGEEHGKTAGEIAIRIFRGEAIKNIPIMEEPPGTYMFDYEQMKKYGVAISEIPQNSIIINKGEYEMMVIAGGKGKIILVMNILIIVILIIIFYTIYLRKRGENDRKTYNEVLKYDKLKTEFFSNISHELRTPLNVILSSVQLLDMYINQGKVIFQDENSRKKITYIKQNGYRLLRLVNNIIDITRIESDFYELQLKNKNIVEIIEDITLSVADYIEDHSINLIFDTNVEEKIMAVDVQKMERIMLNLLSNAVKFTPKGGNIFVEFIDEDKTVKIIVKDNGIGIPKDKQEIIFDRFAQVDTSLSRNSEGSGIGLSLVKALVLLHRGTINLYSEEGKGATFIVELPVKIIEDEGLLPEESTNTELKNKVILEFSDIYD